MGLIFTKDFFKDGSNRFGVFWDGVTDDLSLDCLDCFLMDEGGAGVSHLLKMSEELRDEIIEKIPHNEVVEQYREHFGVVIRSDKTELINFIGNEEEILSILDTNIFISKLEECINFIRANYTF